MGMLDDHPAIAAYDELLLESASGKGYWGRTDLDVFESYYRRHRQYDNHLARMRWSFRYLDELYSKREALDAIGMKLMYDQLWKNPWVWAYMMSRHVRIIHLVRDNLLDIVLSIETLNVRKQPHAHQGDIVESPAVTLQPTTTLSTLKTLEFRIQTARRLLAFLPINHMEVSYERLLEHPELINDIFTFLQVNSHLAQSQFQKLTSSSKRELIENYDQIAQVLAGTRFERFLE
jgi:hypothetical protein